MTFLPAKRSAVVTVAQSPLRRMRKVTSGTVCPSRFGRVWSAMAEPWSAGSGEAAIAAPAARARPLGERSAFDAHRDAHAAADAQARDALLRAALAHLVQQRHENAATRCADRVADRDRAAVDVDLARVPAHLVVDRAGLGGESLVDFQHVEVLRLPAGALQRLLARRHRA